MSINIVVAASDNNVIGKDNKLLWCLPNDMKFFKNTTWALPVIMGRKTFESLGKPLKGRTNIIITRKKDWNPAGTIVVNSLDDAIAAAYATDVKEIFVIGGGEIYKQAIGITNRIYITRVHAYYEGDSYFPVMGKADWKLFSKTDFAADKDHAVGYSFEVWDSVPVKA